MGIEWRGSSALLHSKKEYDSVRRADLFYTSIEFEIPRNFVKLINMYLTEP